MRARLLSPSGEPAKESSRSHEEIRQVLAKYSPSEVILLTENQVASKLGYPTHWLPQLRKEGITHPIKPGGCWLYSDEQVTQILGDPECCGRLGK